MSAAYVASDGTVVQLDGRAGPQVVVTSEDVQDPEKLARELQSALRDIAELKRQWRPRVLYFRDLTVDGTGSTKYPLEHGFDGRVNYEVVRWKPTTIGDPHDLEPHSETTADRLVLVSGWAGVATIRVEEAG